MLTKLLSTSIIAGTFLIGCGGETKEQSSQDVSMPHQVDMSPKKLRDLDPESEEYLNYMKTHNLNSRIYKVSRGEWHYLANINLRDYEHRKQDLKYVFFHDRDNDRKTGYYNPWVSKAGADFLVEDGVYYKYTGTPGSNEWSWEVVEWNTGDVKNEEGIQGINGYGFFYGVTLNQDWTYNSFLGYHSKTPHGYYLSQSPIGMYERKVLVNEQSNREFTISQLDEDIYLHAYKKDEQKLDDNEVYYNYALQVYDKQYSIEGSNLLNENGEVIADNLQYEVRDYDAITIIPKKLLNLQYYDIHNEKGNEVFPYLKINEAIIRDKDWNELYKSN